MASVALELDLWPVVVTRLVGEIDEDELETYLNDFIKLVVGRRLPFVSIVDTTRISGVPSARVRLRVGA